MTLFFSVIANIVKQSREKQTRLRRHVVPRNDRFFIQSNDVIPKNNLAVIPDLIRYPERQKLAPHVQITRVSPNQPNLSFQNSQRKYPESRLKIQV